MGYFRFFFHKPDFFPPCTLHYKFRKKLTKNPLNYYSLKVKNFHGGRVENESARTKNLQGLGLKIYNISLKTCFAVTKLHY